ncbi:MAG TPA: DUF177 domain-containing protein [Longimicrobiales bacterium]|nr:DUF177 domain-containing protein [Longimicrobiales bacterium]
MLIVDLGRLAREGRVRLRQDIAPDDPMWSGLNFTFAGPTHVDLEAQRVIRDVLVQGRVTAEIRHECRRCLEPLTVRLAEDVSMFFREGVAEPEAEAEEVYALPDRGDLDLGPAVREQIVLAVPRFALCREECRGLCATCGKDLNEGECGCVVEEVDDRWAALRRINFE